MADLQQKIQDYFDWLNREYDIYDKPTGIGCPSYRIGQRDAFDLAQAEFKRRFNVKETK